MYNSLLSNRSQTAQIFETLRFQAVLANLSARILGKNTQLKGFAQQAFRITSKRIYLGEQEIPVERINGSVGREKDFDRQFRPLKKYLRDRWIEVYALFKADQLPPIQLFKIGNDYYVKDGHHRLSVARMTGKLALRAKVWEIPLLGQKTEEPRWASKSKKCSQQLAPTWRITGEVL